MYAKSARLLNQNGLTIPGVVNGALAFELYFKSRYILDGGKEFKLEGKYSHDFLALFDQLKAETKAQLIREFDREVAKADPAKARAVEKAAGVKVSLELRDNLIQWHDVFLSLRYVHEFTQKAESKGNVKRYWHFFNEIETTIRGAIFDKDPNCMIQIR